MADIDFGIAIPAPPPEMAQDVERWLDWTLKQAGAVRARVEKRNGEWKCIAEFDDPERAAQCAAFFEVRPVLDKTPETCGVK